MSEFVQRLDRARNRYLKIDRNGRVVGEQARAYPDIDEIEPLEVERPRPAVNVDPLEDYR